MASFWFDITTIVHWRRPPVGVVRVEAECFKYLHGLGDPSIRFCYFDREALRYEELNPADVLRLLELHRPAPPAADSPPPASAAKRVKDQAREMLDRVPSSLRNPVLQLGRKTTPFLRNALHHYRQASGAVTSIGQKVRAAGRSPRPPELGASVPANFAPGDVLASAGLDWDRKDLVFLYQLKLAMGLKVILFCYDLIPVLLPHLCVGEVAGIFARYFVDVAWCADEVMCISKCSQRDFLSLVSDTGAPEPKTSIIRLGANLPSGREQANLEELGVRGKFLLFVSTIERRKNHEVIYRAVAQLVEQGRTDLPQIVFVGMQGWGVADFLNDLRLDPRVRGRFIVLNHVSDAQLSTLYSRAEFTLYPSLYEGWGLPLAEGLAHGKFCLASNSSSLPEVGGSLVEYIDPWESRRWAQRIAHYVDHPEELKQREAAIRAKYTAPLWEDAGRTLHQSAKQLMAAGR